MPFPTLDRDLEVDVAIVGGGLTGAGVAYHLRESRHDVAILEAGEAAAGGGGASARAAGLVLTGISDHLNQLEHGVGREPAVAVWRYTQENARLVEEAVARERIACGFRRPGSYALATFPAEEKDLEASKAILDAAGIEARWLDAAALKRRPGAPRGLAALFYPRDAVVDAPPLVDGLLAAAVGASGGHVRVFERTAVAALDLGSGAGGGARLETETGRTVRATVVVLAAGAHAPRLHRFFADKVLPIRAQGFVTAPGPGGRPVLDAPVSASWGHELYRPLDDGRIVAAGMNWEPKAEEMTYDDAPTDEFQGYLEKFRAHRLPAAPADLAIERRFAAPEAFAADGLPLLGPVPGQPALLAACGYTFRGLSIGLAAARSIARLIQDGTRDYPPCLALARFLG